MKLLRATLGTAAVAVLAACSHAPTSNDARRYEVEIRRTAYGIPHIRARDWASLGYGYGHAQAEDNLCTLADAFVSFRGERSLHFGPDAAPPADSTFGRPRNLDADFFFRLVASDALVRDYEQRQPAEMRQLIEGFAAGHNRYLRDLRAGGSPQAHQACRAAPWVGAISAEDVYRRLYAMNLAGGHARFIEEIAQAQPPSAKAAERTSTVPAPQELDALTQRVAAAHWQVGGREGIGSNAIGFGAAATGTGHGLLLGNPHWYWRGPDRFYQAHLTIPGIVDVGGASLLGTPVIQIGFNDQVAWSHTVSTARRFGIFELTLAPGEPTAYVHEGKTVPMTPVAITVPARRADGTIEPITRTLYRSQFGPLVDLSGYAPALKWNAAKAFAIRDINAANFRIFSSYLRWARARSLDEFIGIQLEEASVPWVNTIAVGRKDARAWYADVGAIPNVPDALAAHCTAVPFGRAFAQAAPGVPFLDGSRAACDWATDADSVQAGAMGRSAMPRLLRSDYVANMNDSHWLTHPAEPLAGFPRIVGPEGSVQSLRTRLGHRLAREAVSSGPVTSALVRRVALDSRVLSAQLFKAEVLNAVCTGRTVPVHHDPLTDERFDPPRPVDVAPACAVLRRWNDSGDTEARGAHLWDEFWMRVSRMPAEELFATPFAPADPLNTPRGLRATAPRVAEALALAALRVQQGGFAVDARRGDYLVARRGGRTFPLFGGCPALGYFTVACSEHRIEEGGYAMDGDPHGNSYLQVVSFTTGGVEAHTLLAFSQSDDPASPHHADYLGRYADKQWVRMPFSEHEIASDPVTRTQLLHEAVDRRRPASLTSASSASSQAPRARSAAQALSAR